MSNIIDRDSIEPSASLGYLIIIIIMTYDKNHGENDCDKCLKTVGKLNLNKVPFIYLDKNDVMHKDVRDDLIKERFEKMLKMSKGDMMLSRLYADKLLETMDSGYRQYWICKDCKP